MTNATSLMCALWDERLWREMDRRPRVTPGGRDVRKVLWAIQVVVVSSMFLTVRAHGQVATGQLTLAQVPASQLAAESLVEPKDSFGETPAACSEPQRLTIPKAAAKRAKVKAQLLNALRESIFDDAKGIVNLTRERQIKDLVSRLAKDQ